MFSGFRPRWQVVQRIDNLPENVHRFVLGDAAPRDQQIKKFPVLRILAHDVKMALALERLGRYEGRVGARKGSSEQAPDEGARKLSPSFQDSFS
jgi:hypothetical protein